MYTSLPPSPSPLSDSFSTPPPSPISKTTSRDTFNVIKISPHRTRRNSQPQNLFTHFNLIDPFSSEDPFGNLTALNNDNNEFDPFNNNSQYSFSNSDSSIDDNIPPPIPPRTYLNLPQFTTPTNSSFFKKEQESDDSDGGPPLKNKTQAVKASPLTAEEITAADEKIAAVEHQIQTERDYIISSIANYKNLDKLYTNISNIYNNYTNLLVKLNIELINKNDNTVKKLLPKVERTREKIVVALERIYEIEEDCASLLYEMKKKDAPEPSFYETYNNYTHLYANFIKLLLTNDTGNTQERIQKIEKLLPKVEAAGIKLDAELQRIEETFQRSMQHQKEGASAPTIIPRPEIKMHSLAPKLICDIVDLKGATAEAKQLIQRISNLHVTNATLRTRAEPKEDPIIRTKQLVFQENLIKEGKASYTCAGGRMIDYKQKIAQGLLKDRETIIGLDKQINTRTKKLLPQLNDYFRLKGPHKQTKQREKLSANYEEINNLTLKRENIRGIKNSSEKTGQNVASTSSDSDA